MPCRGRFLLLEHPFQQSQQKNICTTKDWLEQAGRRLGLCEAGSFRGATDVDVRPTFEGFTCPTAYDINLSKAAPMWPESEKTLDLLREVADGDGAAVNRLMDRHREAVRRMIQMRLDQAVARRVDASDVVQDVMLEAAQRLDGYLANPSMPFHLWLRQLAKDRIIDMHRRHRGACR